MSLNKMLHLLQLLHLIIDNKRVNDDEIECPYCGCLQTDVDCGIKYAENEDEEYVCEECDRKFLINTTITYTHTTECVIEELEKIYNSKKEIEDGNK